MPDEKNDTTATETKPGEPAKASSPSKAKSVDGATDDKTATTVASGVLKDDAYAEGPAAAPETGRTVVGKPSPEKRSSAREDLDVNSVIEQKDEDPLVVVGENVYEEFYFPNTTRPTRRLLFRKGQTVRKSALEALNQAS